MSKHRISHLRLREISSVDRPAQVGAVSVLIKRGEDTAEEIIKATFQEALTGNLLADKVRDVFYKAFEGMWTGKEAFRKALVDELAAGGDGTKASTAYKKWLGTLIDKAASTAKAAGAGSVDEDLLKAFNEAANEWLEEETDMTIKTVAELQAAITKAQGEGDKVTVADVSAIHAAAVLLKQEALLPASGPLAKAAPAADPALAARLDRMEKRDALSVDLRKHYDGLGSDAERDAFLSLDAAGQQAELTKAAGDDPVVHTCLDGTVIRKSAGETVLALAKRNDELARQVAKSNAAAEDVTLEKRANEELGNIGGELVGKKALLKAVDGITDAATKSSVLAVLKAANESAKGVFIRKGSSAVGQDFIPSEGTGEVPMTESEAELDKLAKAHAAANNVSYEQAYATIIQSPAGSQLYKRYVEQEAGPAN